MYCMLAASGSVCLLNSLCVSRTAVMSSVDIRFVTKELKNYRLVSSLHYHNTLTTDALSRMIICYLVIRINERNSCTRTR